MCLIALAHLASDRFPLVIAANRDEEYARPSRAVDFWEGGVVAGGRDALHGGSWLAMSRSGRFAAVTNLRGATKPVAGKSRGELVSKFVSSDVAPLRYATSIASRLHEFGGFHLLAGTAMSEVVQLSGAVTALPPGIHGLSNAPAGVEWPKVASANAAMRGALESESPETMTEALMRVLHTASANDPTRDLFVRGDRYGTRASTVIVVHNGRVTFSEQTYGPRGAPTGPRNTIRFAIEPNR